MLDFQKKLTNTFYAVLTLPATAMGFALSIQISALSWLMSTKYGLEIHEVGIVWAAGPLAGIFGQVIFGLISDKTWFWGGRRRSPYQGLHLYADDFGFIRSGSIRNWCRI